VKYKFVAAYCVYGMTMKDEDGFVTIYQDDDVHVFLTADVTSPLAIVDRQRAIGAVMLGLSVGLTPDGAPNEAWKAQVQETLEKRHLKYKTFAFVVIEVNGDTPVTLPDNLQMHDGYRVCFDAYDKDALVESVHPHVANALSAVRLAGQIPCQFDLVTRGSFLIDDEGQVIHSISYTLGGSATVSQSLNTDQVAMMRELFVPLMSAPELEQSLDLHAQSLNQQETRLRAFMAAWNALEQFTFTVKDKYGPSWEAERDDPNTASARLITLNSIPDASAGKLARAFGKMACILGGSDTSSDIAELLALKDIRNDLSHELKDKELPVERVQTLMDKYLKKHLRSI